MRNILFYPKLAVSGMQRNKIIYVPYLLAASLMVMLFYLLVSMSYIVNGAKIAGGGSISIILSMSAVVCSFITILILFYLNSFVMKQRSQEMGLYSVLGMSRGNLSLLLLFETFFSLVGSLICGIAAGAVFSQLMYLLLLNITRLPVSLDMTLPVDSLLTTGLLFSVGWGIVYLKNVLLLFRKDPISILLSAAAGEREPKSRWLTALVGIVTLTAGYAIAVSVQTPSMALLVFLPATMLVIIATYCIFSALSILILKALRKNKRFYYKPENFIGVSSMIYRMKQNAIGLANICILASAVLVTISSCVCLYIGEEDVIKRRFVRNYSVEVYYTPETPNLPAVLPEYIGEVAARYDLSVGDPLLSSRRTSYTQKDGSTIQTLSSPGNCTLLYCLASELSAYTGEVYTLAPDEVITYGNLFFDGEQITIDGKAFTVKKNIPKGSEKALSYIKDTQAPNFPILFFNSPETIFEIDAENSNYLVCTYSFDIDQEHPNAQQFKSILREELLEEVSHLMSITTESDTRDSFYIVYGGLLFVGLFFVALFLLATVLIIYYKQITEGYEDKRRFRIMQQVGMSDREVRSTIQKQVLMVFSFPILIALIHICFAFPALVKIMSLFAMYNIPLFLFCIAISALTFILFYVAVYFITARTYYRIVKMPEF